jgi:hypothetical protein
LEKKENKQDKHEKELRKSTNALEKENKKCKEIAMPMVGKKKYPYTAKGKAKAKAAAKKSRQKS